MILKHCSLPIISNVIEKPLGDIHLKIIDKWKNNKEISDKDGIIMPNNVCCENDTYFLYDVSDKIGFDVAVCDKCNFNSMVI